MAKIVKKLKKLMTLLTIVVGLTLGLAGIQSAIVNVDAQLHPIMFVAPPEMAFGLSFPQEVRTAEFVVVAKWSYPQQVHYKIIHERKPLPDGYIGDGEDPEMPGYYRNLCPYLSEVTEESEPDYSFHATLNPIGGEDLVDYWLVKFNVPTIIGYVDQGFVGTPIDASGDYGCDIKVAFAEGTYCGDGIKQNPNDFGTGGSQNDGDEECDGEDGVAEGYVCNVDCTLAVIGPECSDNDGDSYAVEGGECGSIDCDDSDNLINPGAAETCNDVDDNCDGQIDEGNPGGGVSCETGQAGICAAGLSVCQSGEVQCQPLNEPQTEVCDGLDNDCDGLVDEGEVCVTPQCEVGAQQSCSSGQLGICAAGTQTCDNEGFWGECLADTGPVSEVCNDGLDNDCDGYLDCNDIDCYQNPACEPIGPYCGDGSCNGSETCETCSTDCGVCQTPSGGGGGGGTIGLYIHTVKLIRGPESGSVVMTWFTNKPANSRVLYDTVSHSDMGLPPNYSYQWSTPTYDQAPKVTFHSVTITGLLPATPYYFRPLSAASPEVYGDEFTFIIEETNINTNVNTNFNTNVNTNSQPPAEQPPAEQPPAEQPPAEQPPAPKPPAPKPPAGEPESEVLGVEYEEEPPPVQEAEEPESPAVLAPAGLTTEEGEIDCQLFIWILLVLNLIVAVLLRNWGKSSSGGTLNKNIWILDLILTIGPVVVWYPQCWLQTYLIIILVIAIIYLIFLYRSKGSADLISSSGSQPTP